METVCNKLEKSMMEVKVTFTTEEWKKAQEKALDKLAKNVKMDGFRKGHVPKQMIKARLGKGAILEEATDMILQQNYSSILLDNDIHPVGQPEVKIDEISEEVLKLTVTAPVAPEVKLGQYKGLEVKKTQVKVTKKEIEAELKNYQNQFAELVIKEEGQVENGDTAVIDFEGFKDGVAFEGGKGENYSLEIGSHTFIPGFEEQVIGMKSGEEKDIEVTFPEDYGAKDLAGAKATFKVKVHEIKVKEKRELDEDFFEDLGMDGVNSEETLKEEIKKSISAQKEMEAENKYIDTILEEVSKNVEVDIPKEMVDEEVTRLMGRFEQQMRMQGISLDLYYQFTRSTEADLRNQLEKEAYSNVLYRLMLEEIMNLEKIEVSVEEAEKEASELAKKYEMEKDEFLKQFGGIDMVQYDLEMRKTIELLKEANK